MRFVNCIQTQYGGASARQRKERRTTAAGGEGGQKRRRRQRTKVVCVGGGGKGQRRGQRHMANMCLVFGSAGVTAHSGGRGGTAMRRGALEGSSKFIMRGGIYP